MDAFFQDFIEKESSLAFILLPIVAIALGIFLSWMVFAVLRLQDKKHPSFLKGQMLERLRKPVFFFIPLVLLLPVLNYFDITTVWIKVLEAFVVIGLAWLLLGMLNVAEDVVKQKFAGKSHHLARERKAFTQLRFLKSIGVVVILIISVASILWNIPGARRLGNTILTSAGVVGIIVGVAAQKSISNLIVGFQLAFTQALKINDEVVIEGEFGKVEDLTLTYVVVKTWDWRRLILPLNYFNDKPYVNWTFKSKPLIASVYFHVDYTFPVTELRTKLKDLIKDHPLWDKKIAKLAVTNCDRQTMELRADFSVKNATNAWDLRCEVREELIAFIQTNYPEALPKFRGLKEAPVVG